MAKKQYLATTKIVESLFFDVIGAFFSVWTLRSGADISIIEFTRIAKKRVAFQYRLHS